MLSGSYKSVHSFLRPGANVGIRKVANRYQILGFKLYVTL